MSELLEHLDGLIASHHYLRYVALKQARRADIARQVEENWVECREGWWDRYGPGVGPSDEALTRAREDRPC